MQLSQRLDQRLLMLREEVRTMTQEKERGEQVWRERLQRCQRHLKAKEEEMSRQCHYFENFKAQLQHKLSLARDREESLQNRIYTLEKQLLDMTVSAATGMATISAVRITAGTVTHWEEQERLLSMRGEGEGEEERKEERRRQWQPNVGTEREGGRESDEGKTEKEMQGRRVKDPKQNSNEARLQGFIVRLKEDLKALLEREEDGMTERRGLMEQLQEAQENSHFLGCKVEEMKAEVHQLQLSESSLLEEVEELREENHRLLQVLGDASNQTRSQSSTAPESTCLGQGTSSPTCSPAVCPVPSNTLLYTTATGHSSAESPGEVHETLTEERGQPHSSAVPHVHHQEAAENTQNIKEDHSSSAKSETQPKNDPLNLFRHFGSKTNPSLQSLSLSTETVDEFNLGTWCSRGVLNLEESPSEESDALREAYRSLGLGEDFGALQEQRDHLEVALQHMQEQLQMMSQENTRLKLRLRKEEQEAEVEQGSSTEKIGTLPTSDGAEDNTVLALAQEDLAQALNQENQALADRIQELLAHIELREEEFKREEMQLREHISKLEEDGVRWEQENQEQGCLITELTKKTEDDLNTIMELQQKLMESEQHVEESQVDNELCGSQMQTDYTATKFGTFQQNNLEENVDSLVENVLKGEEPHLMSSQQADDLTKASAPGSQHDAQSNLLQKSLQSSLHVSSLTYEVGQLTKLIQSLKREQQELSGDIHSLREQHGEVALSVQTQTEVKQQLTRTVWGLKEEKDNISQSLSGLKKEREQLTRSICGLKDERDQFMRSMSGLKEEKEQLTTSLSGLRREKEKVLESLSNGKEERDQITQSLQSLQTESVQLSEAVLCLKQERDKLANSLKSLKEQRDNEQSSYTLQEDCDKLIKSVSSLREEKERIEHSISCLKQEEKQIKLLLQGLREERDRLQAAFSSQTQTEGSTEKQHLLNPNTKTETAVGAGGYASQRRQTDHLTNEQNDLMRQIEALEAELKRSQGELDKSHLDIKRLQSEVCQSEARREEAERKTAQAADKVKELQSKMTSLVRERTDALSLKTQTEEQYNILTAQLKAKTVALEELNSEYIVLKRQQGSKDDLSTAHVSLRTRYNDIRAKYDALLKKKSQKDLDISPLKAKLSCLVAKCQERNSMLAQMMKAMHRQCSVDSTLTQQVDQLLSDTALQDYTAAFTSGTNVKTRDHSTGFTTEFISKFQDCTSGFTPDQSCSTISPLTNQQDQNVFTPESGEKCRESQSEKLTSLVPAESTTNCQNCSSEVTPAPTGSLKKNANSPVPTSPVQEHSSARGTPSPVIPTLKDTVQLFPSASGPKKLHHPDTKGKSSPDPTSSPGSLLSPPPPSASTHVSVSRRLSSPEKIINLHEQLQKTLMSSYQAPVSRGRRQQPRKSLSFAAPADLRPVSQTKTLSFNTPCTNSPATAASSQANHAPAVAAANKSTTLYNAVASRSANVTFSPGMFTNHHFKADTSKTAMSALSNTSNILFATMGPNKAKSTSSSGVNMTISPKLTKQISAIPDTSDAKHTASVPLTTTFDVLKCSDTNPKTTASGSTAPGMTTAPKADHSNMPSRRDGAAPAYNLYVLSASCTQSAHCSPERSNKRARNSTGAQDKTKTATPKPGAPAEVCSVEVINTVGQSSLMIGWERPPLDELGCSNGTFVYGYRVFVDGDFHKSVMSSACTKCILENVDLSVPVHISVKTLGSNGLSSNSVHTTYRTPATAGHH
ncbi:uveal autoantigen with coiled-coil domains and ankyrin repeats-like isoform X2 [Pempheris klunzingeri]|uniref:uveal autoantigen with coiled-coil domains and ankyrin repeats-like isoform X2 n=1 Tax=Pempheris klunzingeri TaxID=3127111 RepID=UPI00398174C0